MTEGRDWWILMRGRKWIVRTLGSASGRTFEPRRTQNVAARTCLAGTSEERGTFTSQMLEVFARASELCINHWECEWNIIFMWPSTFAACSENYRPRGYKARVNNGKLWRETTPLQTKKKWSGFMIQRWNGWFQASKLCTGLPAAGVIVANSELPKHLRQQVKLLGYLDWWPVGCTSLA